MAYSNKTIATTATAIVAKNLARIALLVRNNSAVTIYLGEDSSVTTSNGYPLEAGDEIVYENPGESSQLPAGVYRGPLYGIVATGTADLRYMDHTLTRQS